MQSWRKQGLQDTFSNQAPTSISYYYCCI